MPEPVRFLREDIMSGVVTDITLENWSYGETLNRPDALNASVPLTSDDATEEILDPWRTAIYAVRGTNVEFGGILTPPSLSLGAASLSINCFGWLGYFDHRIIRKDYTPSNTDQFTIFKHLVDDAQDEATFGDDFDLGITVTWDALSGVERDRSDDYRPWQAKNLGEALRQLAAVDDGFDFAMRYTLNTETDRIDKEIVLYYPTKGRDTGHLFEYERGHQTNIVQRGFADPVDFAWVGDGWGSGNDETRIKSAYVDETLRGVYPPFDAAPSWSSVSQQVTLDDHTDAWFARSNRPRRVPVVRVDPDLDPMWGAYELGDTANFRIIDGYGSTGLIPQKNRITSRKVASEGTYDLVLADPLGSADETLDEDA
jgi:hypothetical protein